MRLVKRRSVVRCQDRLNQTFGEGNIIHVSIHDTTGKNKIKFDVELLI